MLCYLFKIFFVVFNKPQGKAALENYFIKEEDFL